MLDLLAKIAVTFIRGKLRTHDENISNVLKIIFSHSQRIIRDGGRGGGGAFHVVPYSSLFIYFYLL